MLVLQTLLHVKSGFERFLDSNVRVEAMGIQKDANLVIQVLLLNDTKRVLFRFNVC